MESGAVRNRIRRRSKRYKSRNNCQRDTERETVSAGEASRLNMERLAAQSSRELATNAALMDAGLTWAADWRNGGKKFTRHNDGGPLR